jgi:hypothetical protein
MDSVFQPEVEPARPGSVSFFIISNGQVLGTFINGKLIARADLDKESAGFAAWRLLAELTRQDLRVRNVGGLGLIDDVDGGDA